MNILFGSRVRAVSKNMEEDPHREEIRRLIDDPKSGKRRNRIPKIRKVSSVSKVSETSIVPINPSTSTTPKISINCSRCSEDFSRQSDMQKHQKPFHQGEKQQSKICNKCFAHYVNFRSHIAKGRPIKNTFDCPKCEKSFPTGYRIKHNKLVHSDSE
ncbi:unnamed protein product [Allacma fusca]|uniref:C2H2-type domain-containing protein n=1 Tax=Allacma fusca TaxID=39272 RepID=A0A8J2LCX4_9HEXA|nr:unnamed protein product [Allacma fusca]